MAIVAERSATEGRWVRFSEMARELCELSGQCSLTDEECESRLVDPVTGALDLASLADEDVGLIENSNYKEKLQELLRMRADEYKAATTM